MNQTKKKFDENLRDSFTTESESSSSSSEIEERYFSILESYKANNRAPSIHSFLIITEAKN